MGLKIGCVSYINAFPFSLPFRLGCIKSADEFIFAHPTTLNTRLRSGELDLALSSCVEYLDGDYQLAPGFGIACFGEVMSVNLYSRLPIQALNQARIGLCPHSATANSLLQVLCTHFWKVTPNFETFSQQSNSPYDAFLLIGDEALRRPTISQFQTIDLGKAWQQMTGLPFVFALFAAQKKLDKDTLCSFQNQLEEALKWSAENFDLLEKEAFKQCPLPIQTLRHYFSKLRYQISESELRGLKTFATLRMKNVPTLCP